MAYLTISKLRAHKPALMEFVRAAGQGVLTQLVGRPAAGTGGPGSAVTATAAAAVHSSPFAATAAAATMAAGGAAAQQTVQQEIEQQEQQPEQKPDTGTLLGGGRAGPVAAVTLELPGAADTGNMGMSGLVLGGLDLEGASSFNMDLSITHHFGSGCGAVKQEPQERCRVGETPDPAAALGPAAAH